MLNYERVCILFTVVLVNRRVCISSSDSWWFWWWYKGCGIISFINTHIHITVCLTVFSLDVWSLRLLSAVLPFSPRWRFGRTTSLLLSLLLWGRGCNTHINVSELLLYSSDICLHFSLVGGLTVCGCGAPMCWAAVWQTGEELLNNTEVWLARHTDVFVPWEQICLGALSAFGPISSGRRRNRK